MSHAGYRNKRDADDSPLVRVKRYNLQGERWPRNNLGWDLDQGAPCFVHQYCQMAKFDPFPSLDCARVEGRGRNPRKGRDQILQRSVAET